MVGLHAGYERFFAEHADGFDLCVLEEPELIARQPEQYAAVTSGQVLPIEYQQSEDFLDPLDAWLAHLGRPDAVVPAWEYGVAAAGLIAEHLGLPGVGRTAIEACTDKHDLRRRLTGTNVLQPRWALVRSGQELARFDRGRPYLVKPTNRHASVGVIRVSNAAAAGQAWRMVTAVTEGRTATTRYVTAGYLAEEIVDGYQVSVETMIVNAKVRYQTIDLMLTGAGPYYPILSVVVPAPIQPADQAAILDAAAELAGALRMQDGMLHSEWKVTEGRPYLIECAARVPGAFTAELTEHAYPGFSMYESQIRALAGIDVPAPPQPCRAAGVRWFHPAPGRLARITGLPELASDPAVLLWRIKAKPGDTITDCIDGWHRVGYFLVEGESGQAVLDKIDRVLSEVRFDMVS
jgi:biotin carboxylase